MCLYCTWLRGIKVSLDSVRTVNRHFTIFKLEHRNLREHLYNEPAHERTTTGVASITSWQRNTQIFFPLFDFHARGSNVASSCSPKKGEYQVRSPLISARCCLSVEPCWSSVWIVENRLRYFALSQKRCKAEYSGLLIFGGILRFCWFLAGSVRTRWKSECSFLLGLSYLIFAVSLKEARFLLIAQKKCSMHVWLLSFAFPLAFVDWFVLSLDYPFYLVSFWKKFFSFLFCFCCIQEWMGVGVINFPFLNEMCFWNFLIWDQLSRVV